MNTRRKSTLFLTEQLIVIAVFALCAIACISILTTSFFMARDSRDTANALIAAQNYAEAIKAADGNMDAVVNALSDRGRLIYDDNGTDFGFSVYMDDLWMERNFINAESAAYTLTIKGSAIALPENVRLTRCEILICNNSGRVLVWLPVAGIGQVNLQ